MRKAPTAGNESGAFEGTHTKSTAAPNFAGTANPRHLRILAALLTRARPREEIDRIAGASNGPDAVRELRERGLLVPCERTPCYDRDGREVMRGVYWFTDADRRKVARWQRERATGGAS